MKDKSKFRSMDCAGCQCNGCYECASANCDICYRAEFAEESCEDYYQAGEHGIDSGCDVFD